MRIQCVVLVYAEHKNDHEIIAKRDRMQYVFSVSIKERLRTVFQRMNMHGLQSVVV